MKTVYPTTNKVCGGYNKNYKLSFEIKISLESVLNKNYKLLNAYVQCVYIVSAKYQIAQSKAVVGVERPIKALSMHIQKRYKGIIVSVLRAVIVSKNFFFNQTP